MGAGYEWAAHASEEERRSISSRALFGRSLHIRFVDAGACGACMSEARQINNPYYNMHRLGFFMTPTPRNADVLLVAGPVSDAMRLPLRKTYEAMPTPKRVVAIGACAVSGGVFGPSFAASGGVAEIIPVDVVVPGCPPPPLAILHGLLLVGREKAAIGAGVAARRSTDRGMSTAASFLSRFSSSARGSGHSRSWFRARWMPIAARDRRIAGGPVRSARLAPCSWCRRRSSRSRCGRCSRWAR